MKIYGYHIKNLVYSLQQNRRMSGKNLENSDEGLPRVKSGDSGENMGSLMKRITDTSTMMIFSSQTKKIVEINILFKLVELI